ncbi:MAG: hypothetical protein IKW81_07380 [Pseudobutyrivibrio sp.]|nr:hypothetical protein [Pseudobutyrivibrio sp.]
MAYFMINDERKQIEIYFDAVPSVDLRNDLKEHGWRYFRLNNCWYKKITDENETYARFICDGHDKKDLAPTKGIEILSTKLYGKGDSIFINNKGINVLFKGARFGKDEEGILDFFTENITDNTVALVINELQINGYIVKANRRGYRCKPNDSVDMRFYIDNRYLKMIHVRDYTDIHSLKAKMSCYLGEELLREKGVEFKIDVAE